MAGSKDKERHVREELRRLWDIDQDSRPGPRPTHSARTIARAGIAIADEDGLSGVTMRNVAARLSVSAMSLYNQVPGKAELIEVMIDEVMSETALSPDGDWRIRTEALAWANWHCFLQHPWLLSLERHRPVLGPNILRKYQEELAVFEGLGLSDVEMDFALGSLLALVRGCVATAIDTRKALDAGGETEREWWSLRQPLFERLQTGETYPIASRVGAAIGEFALGVQSPEQRFQFGLHLWMSGISELVSGRDLSRVAPGR